MQDQQWEVRGAFRESGKDAILIIAAPTQAAAEHEAMQHGLLVVSCWPASATGTLDATTVPLPQEPLNYAIPVGPSPQAAPVLIEQTSKRFKWQLLTSFLVCMFGLVSSCMFAPLAALASPRGGAGVLIVGALCFFGGLAWGIVARVVAWWHHG